MRSRSCSCREWETSLPSRSDTSSWGSTRRSSSRRCLVQLRSGGSSAARNGASSTVPVASVIVVRGARDPSRPRCSARGIIGFEREVRDHEAGLRTHLLVAVGSSLFTIVSAYGFAEFFNGNAAIRVDPSRIAAQIVAGVGFLGAGAIFRQGALVRGLTTAATLWAVAAIGLAVGAGLYTASVVATALVLVSLGPLRCWTGASAPPTISPPLPPF